jgi:hypothetical protein
MRVLGFKKWYETKLENQSSPIRSTNLLENIGGHIYKFPKRMLHLEMDILGESNSSKRSSNPIVRYLINQSAGDIKSISENLKNILNAGRSEGRFFYLTGFDFTSSDYKKCYKNSLKAVENFRSSIGFLKDIPVRGMGRIEQIHESYNSKIPSNLLKQRVELVECFFNPEEISENIEIPFYFNPNDYALLEKYEGCLRGMLIQSILKNESFKMEITAVKPWPTSKGISLTESEKNKQNFSLIYEMKYKDPKKSSLIHPENKPSRTDNKISIKDITEKRANSVISYLQKLTNGMPIEYVAIGGGYKEGNQTLGIAIK